MKTLRAIIVGLLIMVIGGLVSTGYLAWYCRLTAWWPFQTHQWILGCMAENPDRQFRSLLIFMAFGLAAGLVANFLRRGGKTVKEFGLSKWAAEADVVAAGLVMKAGQKSRLIRVLGRFGTHILTYTGDAHVLVCGGNRSGKGRGGAIPTLLSLASSVVVHDSKGEFMFGDPKHGFPGTSGYRSKLGRVIYFNPKDRRSARFNPLLMVRKGDNEVADMQRLILTLLGRAPRDFWEKGGGRMLLAIGLHILYCEPISEKNLAGMGRFLDRGDEGLEHIMATQAHPLATRIAQGFFPGGVGGKDSDKVKGMRSGLYFTARDFLSFYDDPVAAEITSGLCQFEPADLARHDNPTTLYLVPPADDQTRAAPLLSLIVGQILGELVSQPMGRTASGYPKRHDTVLLLDEFTALGRMDELVSKLPQAPGYGVTAHLFIQSISQLDEVYTPNAASTIIDNCGCSVWFAAADPRTGQRISNMIGNASEIEQTISVSRQAGAWFGGVTTTGEREVYRPVLDTGAVRELAPDTELVFVNGCRPIRAKKLQYDKEPIFRPRLLPPPPVGDGHGNYPGLEFIPSPWWNLKTQQPPTPAPVEAVEIQKVQPPLPTDDVPDFQPEWMTA